MDEKQFFLSPDLGSRLAAIDIGTNSIRLVVAEPMRGGNYRILEEEKESTRLGRSLSRTGRLDEEAIEKSLAALRRMKQIAEGFQVTQTKTIATAAVREAENGHEFCRRARQELGLDIEIVSAKHEALLAFFSVQRNFDLSDKPVAVVDIGGGSTEIVLALGNLVEAIYTTKLGAVRLSDMYPDAADHDNLIDFIDRQLKKEIKNPVFVPHILFGSGGTFTSLASMVMASKGQTSLPVRGYQITRAEVRHLLSRLKNMSVAQRAAVPGLSVDRADIIVAGLAIIDQVMDHCEVNVLQVHNRGVRDGLLLTMIEQNAGNRQSPPDREASIDRLAKSCGSELAHGRHVALLAGSMHEQLATALDLRLEDRPLLEAAARLQDVGYLINYDQHHKHSYHLIRHSRLEGFQPHELEIVANVARYHRGSDPKRKHANFRQLSSTDRERVEQMAAILRVAGGLDRSNTQQVQDVHVEVKDDGEVAIQAVAASDPELDLWGARRRANLFEKVFKRSLRIGWHPPDAASTTNNHHAGGGSKAAAQHAGADEA